MNLTLLKIPLLLFCLSAAAPAGAAPATVENADYKVSLSETLPGLDDQLAPQQGPTITVTVQDKFNQTATAYPLGVYAVNDYSLSDNALDLVCRLTPKTSDSGPRYSCLQLNLSNPSDSRRFQPLKRFSLSPDSRELLAVFDGQGRPDALALIRLADPPAQATWLYAAGGVNMFQKALPAMAADVTLLDPVGWSADSGTAAFLATADDGAVEGTNGSKVFLVFVELNRGDYHLAAEPVDLSPYHYKAGSVVTDIKCSGGKATLFFSQADSPDILQADFPLPQPAAP